MGNVVHINVNPKRLLNLREAAEYVGYGSQKFKSICPVAPIKMPCGYLRFDIQDLDAWVESLKQNAVPSEEDNFLKRFDDDED